LEFDDMSRVSGRIGLAIVTATILVVVFGLLWWSSAQRPLSAPFSASELVSERPLGTVRVEGVVVSSQGGIGETTLVVADSSAPEIGVLTLRYAGAQRMTFGRGVVVIAFGRLMPDGDFEVDEFVVKGPTRSRG
jgi:hypothetical protein